MAQITGKLTSLSHKGKRKRERNGMGMVAPGENRCFTGIEEVLTGYATEAQDFFCRPRF